nr:hypothetical protein Iba_chr13eCG10290 [Ipomoea batatas]
MVDMSSSAIVGEDYTNQTNEEEIKIFTNEEVDHASNTMEDHITICMDSTQIEAPIKAKATTTIGNQNVEGNPKDVRGQEADGRPEVAPLMATNPESQFKDDYDSWMLVHRRDRSRQGRGRNHPPGGRQPPANYATPPSKSARGLGTQSRFAVLDGLDRPEQGSRAKMDEEEETISKLDSGGVHEEIHDRGRFVVGKQKAKLKTSHKKLAHGGHEVGDTSEDPLPIPSDEEKEVTPPPPPEAKIGSPLNPDYDSDYVEFLTEFLADDSLGDTPPASPATPDTAFPFAPSVAFEADRPSPPSQTPSMVSTDSPAASV